MNILLYPKDMCVLFFFIWGGKFHNKEATRNPVTALSDKVWNKLQPRWYFLYFKNRLYLNHLRETSQSQGSLIQCHGQGINPWYATKSRSIKKACKQTTVEMKLRWMESGVVRVTSSASIKHMARDWKRNKGQKARGDRQGEEQWECKWGVGDARPWRRERGRKHDGDGESEKLRKREKP